MSTFSVGETYTKNQIYTHLNVPTNQQGGKWGTGYLSHDDEYFIFANIGVVARTGHEHDNSFIGNDLSWAGKPTSKLSNPSIQAMLDPDATVHVFTRTGNRDPWTYEGRGRAAWSKDVTPVKVLWSFDDRELRLPEEVDMPEATNGDNDRLYKEGAVRQVQVNRYERSGAARRKCIEAHGDSCAVCGFNFGEVYGDFGRGYIHVHHLKPIARIGEAYELDPVQDLRPVCPNCHAMIHRMDTPLSIEELREVIQDAARDRS